MKSFKFQERLAFSDHDYSISNRKRIIGEGNQINEPSVLPDTNIPSTSLDFKHINILLPETVIRKGRSKGFEKTVLGLPKKKCRKRNPAAKT